MNGQQSITLNLYHPSRTAELKVGRIYQLTDGGVAKVESISKEQNAVWIMQHNYDRQPLRLDLIQTYLVL